MHTHNHGWLSARHHGAPKVVGEGRLPKPEAVACARRPLCVRSDEEAEDGNQGVGHVLARALGAVYVCRSAGGNEHGGLPGGVQTVYPNQDSPLADVGP